MSNKKKSLNIPNPKYLRLIIRMHSYDQYRDRVDARASNEEIDDFYKSAVDYGKVTNIRENLIHSGSGQVEVRYIYRGIGFLAILDKTGTLAVTTCYGDEKLMSWHRKQRIVSPYLAALNMTA